jgi:hypothetical protein
MAHTSYDPRKKIRETIGTLHAVKKGSWDEQYCIPIADSHGDTLYIPIYLGEEAKSLDEPSMPFIDIKIMLVEYTPHDVGALTRRHKAYLDVGIWFTHTDNVDSTAFGKKIIDKLQNLIRTTQENCGFSGCPIDFININTVRYLEESNGRQVVFHYVLELYCIYYD